MDSEPDKVKKVVCDNDGSDPDADIGRIIPGRS